MPTFRYPVVVYRDPAGGCHAAALDHGAVGFGLSVADAKADLRDFLTWRHRHQPWAAPPDFLDPELRWQRLVTVLGLESHAVLVQLTLRLPHDFRDLLVSNGRSAVGQELPSHVPEPKANTRVRIATSVLDRLGLLHVSRSV